MKRFTVTQAMKDGRMGLGEGGPGELDLRRQGKKKYRVSNGD